MQPSWRTSSDEYACTSTLPKNQNTSSVNAPRKTFPECSNLTFLSNRQNKLMAACVGTLCRGGPLWLCKDTQTLEDCQHKQAARVSQSVSRLAGCFKPPVWFKKPFPPRCTPAAVSRDNCFMFSLCKASLTFIQ